MTNKNDLAVVLPKIVEHLRNKGMDAAFREPIMEAAHELNHARLHRSLFADIIRRILKVWNGVDGGGETMALWVEAKMAIKCKQPVSLCQWTISASGESADTECGHKGVILLMEELHANDRRWGMIEDKQVHWCAFCGRRVKHTENLLTKIVLEQ